MPGENIPRSYRHWFFAAAIYNVLWGGFVGLAPLQFFRILGIAPFQPVAIFQCIGMMVGVYGYGYYLIARDPERYAAFVWVGLAGKMLGPIGFIYSAARGEMP